MCLPGTCSTADEALELWAKRRTDETIKGKVQGVQTMSQVRYVRYVAEIVSKSISLAVPTPRTLRSIRLRNLFADGFVSGPHDALPCAPKPT